MTVSDVLALLDAERDERGMRNWEKLGSGTAGMKSYGVGLTRLRKIAKSIGCDRKLAQALWKTDVYDARVLALLIDDPARITRDQAEQQVEELSGGMLSHVFASCDATLAKTPFVVELADQWVKSKDPVRRDCGYGLLYEASKFSGKKAPSDEFFIAHVERIAKTIEKESDKVRLSMGAALMGIGKRNVALNKAALKVARKTGPIEFTSASGECEPFDVVKHLTTGRLKEKLGVLVVIGMLAAATAAAQQPEIATAVSFTEGPTVDRDGNVYFSEMVSLRIMKLSATGVLSVFREQSNNANGLLIDPEGRLIACEGANSQRTGVPVTFKPRVTRTDLRTGKVEVLADGYEGKPFVGPNDVTIDGKGRLYVTDLPGGAVYRLDGPGKMTRILGTPDIQRPNGIQISPDDKTLYLIEANQAKDGARMIRAFDLRADGSAGNMRVHYNFYPGRSGDGMSIDTQGNLYVSAGMNQLRGTSETLDTKTGVYVISPEGKLLKFIPIAEDFITNNAFGGTDMKTLYVTAGKTLYKFRTDVAGLPR